MISDLILITKRLLVPSSFGRRDGLRDFFDQYPEGVYVATDYGAPAGWEGYSVYFGGASERLTGWFETMLRDVYAVERLFRNRVSGVLVLTFRCRLKARVGAIGMVGGGGNPLDDWWGLKLTMPNGGTVILRKTGNPNALSLEVSTDAVNWTAWELVGTDYTYTLAAGETLCIRNVNTSMSRFSLDLSNYYNFIFSDITEASGSIMSLSCNNKTVIDISVYNYNFCYLFRGSTHLISAPELPATEISPACYLGSFRGCSSLVTGPSVLPATISKNYCYSYMFYGCNSLIYPPEIKAETTANNSCSVMFYDCLNLSIIKTRFIDISAQDSLSYWLENVSLTGDFYCPQELTIPTGASGIPTGWTRHDI